MNATGDQDLRAWLRANDHVARVSGKEYVLLSGLLALAHMHGVESQETTLLHFDMEKGVAVAVTTITGTRGTFTGHGDSTPYNTGKMVAGAFIRMAETSTQSFTREPIERSMPAVRMTKVTPMAMMALMLD